MGHDSYRSGGKRNTYLTITSINGQSIPEAISVELLPGEYKIGGRYVHPLGYWDYFLYFSFPLNVEKGVEYTLGVTPGFKKIKDSYYYDRRVLSSDPDKSNNSKRIFISQ